ncbi:unnamed protein product [Rotaria magnacalcarata]|uniref:Uncharacterized protein n=1 Tax=Rotaria magnacalcarata TaxID=392030 RepID=A0A814J5A1_9BILA|nr:unnamed protein product [Rotaria magnacalcarata]CAF4980127.1 unnamed protein product [Rotaria magnacalcarata]CAF5032052.1 unnamed protein product [Rotaria magnacalcarata]
MVVIILFFYTLLTSLPTYFATILTFNLRQNGFIYALQYVAQFLMTLIFGSITDRIRARDIVSITILRKLQTILGAVVCCILSIGSLGLYSCGALISHLDVASNYAGTLAGITNCLGTIPDFVGPYVVACIDAFGCVAYCILFNGDEQPWNRTTEARQCNDSIAAIDT